MRFHFLMLFVLTALLTACTSAPFPPDAGLADLGKVEVKTPVKITAGSASIYWQAGKQVAQPSLHDPVCQLTSWQRSELSQTLLPDAFRIANISYRRGDTSQGFGVYGSSDLGLGFTFGLGSMHAPIYPNSDRYHDSPRLLQAAVVMRLVSKKQPLFYQLTCYGSTTWGPFVDPPSIEEMQQVLGAQVELSIVKQAAE